MKQQSSSIVIALLLVAGGNSIRTNAQTAADNFPLPTTVPSGTKVQIDGSSSLQAVNQGLRERFQKQFPGTDVAVPTQYQGSDSGVKAIAEDKADLAGIGRLLTKEEKAQGLAAKTIGRSKIAIIVKDSNPYTGNLTLKDFAKIYRGEVTDWSQLPSANGAKGKIKVIDRPETSDTRRAFANYPVFQNGKLKTGQNAEKITEDSTQAVVDKLGDDGIGYAPADQIKNIQGIRAVTLHSTQPDNPKYPFSQPLAYAYKNKDGKISEGTKAFLGYVSDPTGQAAIKESVAAGVSVGAAGTPSPGTNAPPTTDTDTASTAPGATVPGTTGTEQSATTTSTNAGKNDFPWWILSLVAIAGGLLWLVGRKSPVETAPVPPVAEPTSGIRPLYPPPPTNRTARGDGLSGDLSGDLTSSPSGYRPSSDLRSGDLRSGDLSGLPIPPMIDQPNLNAPNVNFNGVVDTVKTQADNIGLAGGAAIAGGAAAAAALGKGMFDLSKDRVEDLPSDVRLPEIKAPEIDLSNPLEGLKDKSSNLIPNLDVNNPLEAIKDKTGDFIQGGGATAAAIGGAALAGGAGLVAGAGKFFDRDHPESSDLSLETPDFNFGNPLDTVRDKAGDLQDRAGDLIPDLDLNDDPFNFGNPLDTVKDKAGDLQDRASELIPDLDLNDDPFNFGNPLDTVKEKAGDLQDRASDLIPGDMDLDFSFGDLTAKTGDFLSGGGAAAGAAGAAAIAGGAALFGGEKPQIADLELSNPELDTFDRDLESISLDGLEEDPFAGLSDLLGEETGDISDDPKPETSDFRSSLKDKAADLLEDGKGFGGAALAGGAAAAVGAGQAVQSFFKGKDAPTTAGDDISGNLYSEGQITLVSPSPTQAYAHWEIPVRLKRQLREQGGQKLVVRLYDITNAGSNIDLPSIFQEFECSDSAWDLEIPIQQSEHRYLAEIGYVTGDNRWLMLARSAPLWIRSNSANT
jgi:ABC-type phosphate transport system substrate-binding protein